MAGLVGCGGISQGLGPGVSGVTEYSGLPRSGVRGVRVSTTGSDRGVATGAPSPACTVPRVWPSGLAFIDRVVGVGRGLAEAAGSNASEDRGTVSTFGADGLAAFPPLGPALHVPSGGSPGAGRIASEGGFAVVGTGCGSGGAFAVVGAGCGSGGAFAVAGAGCGSGEALALDRRFGRGVGLVSTGLGAGVSAGAWVGCGGAGSVPARAPDGTSPAAPPAAASLLLPVAAAPPRLGSPDCLIRSSAC